MNTKNVLERYRLCPKCGNFSNLEEEHLYCILCGTKLIDRCPHCEAPITNPTARFCYRCGYEYANAYKQNTDLSNRQE